MSTLQLPSEANLTHLRHQAKALHRAYRASDHSAIERIRDIHPRFAAESDEAILAASLPLAEAQFVLAREYGFHNWEQMKLRVQNLRDAPQPRWRDVDATPASDQFQDDPDAHACLDRMLRALREADSLYYKSEFLWQAGGKTVADGQYRMWLKKPGYTRLEVLSDGDVSGVLVGDGARLWRYWPGGRPAYAWHDGSPQQRALYTSYMVEESAANETSIWHASRMIGASMILNPSIFHGYKCAMLPCMDGVASLGAQSVDGEECGVIEVSLMDGQRVWALWLSVADGLPRRQEQRLYVEERQFTRERWVRVERDSTIDESQFAWEPPADWVEFRQPSQEDNRLPVGAIAPDFERTALDGQRICLSAMRGSVVLLSFGRIGCQSTRDEAGLLERLHQEFRDRGLIVVGFNRGRLQSWSASIARTRNRCCGSSSRRRT